jgi:hypothetical protein
MPKVGTWHDSFSSSSSTEVRPKRSYEIELGDEIVGAESVRYEVAGIVIPLLFMLLLPVDLLQLSCGFALESVRTLLIESLLGWLSTMGSGEDDEVIVSN